MPDNNNNGHTILVVEDDEGVLDLAVNMFEFSGYTVLQAKDAAEGLACFQEHPEIDLVFSDLILPGGVTGIEMAKNILEERPGTLFLMATGYSEKGRALAAKTERLENMQCIAKPYDIHDVTAKVESMIASRPAAAAP